MAPKRTNSDNPADTTIPIEQIIFSCGVCQATVADVYATKTHNQGFHSGSGDEDGVVTKFWMCDRSHTFCGKHLKGGGLPFHPNGSSPSAACPVCTIRNNDPQIRELFAIRGLVEGEYDQAIPRNYLVCPPLSLDAEEPAMHAMRFQYQQLVHFAQQAARHYKSVERKKRALENALSQERKQWRSLEAQMRDRIAVLEKGEARLKIWERKRDSIHHSLRLIPKMTRDMAIMRQQLSHFGIETPDIDYFLPDPVAPPQASQQPPTTSQFNGVSSATMVGGDYRSSSSTRKRKQPAVDQYADEEQQQENEQQERSRLYNQDNMPPRLERQRQQHEMLPPVLQPASRSTFLHPASTNRAQPTRSQQVLSQSQPQSAGRQQPNYSFDYHPSATQELYPRDTDVEDNNDYYESHRSNGLPYRSAQPFADHQADEPEPFTRNGQCFLDGHQPIPMPMEVPSAPQKRFLTMPPRRRSQNYDPSAATAALYEERHPSQMQQGTSGNEHGDHGYDSVMVQASQQPLRDRRSIPSQSQGFTVPALPRHQISATPRRQPPDPVPTVAASPFFKKPSLPSRIASTPRSTVPSGLIRPQRAVSTDEHRGRYPPSNRRQGGGATGYERVLNSGSRAGKLPSHHQPQGLRLSQAEQPSLAVRYTPQTSNPAFRPPGRQPLTVQPYQPSSQAWRPPSRRHISRLTLPSRSRMDGSGIRNSQDPALSMVHGLRGSEAAGRGCSQAGFSASYTPYRGISSSARRIVTRDAPLSRF